MHGQASEMTPIRFRPWRGDEYERGIADTGVRVLALGESHYAEPAHDTEALTEDVVKRYLHEGGRTPAFTKIGRLLGVAAGSGGGDPRSTWQQIAFYNFVQQIVGRRARERPSSDMWSTSTSAFADVVDQLKPGLIVIFGVQLWAEIAKRIANCVVADGPVMELSWSPTIAVVAVHVTHPAGRGFSYAKLVPVVKAGLALASARRDA